ncbi:MAG: hypothetical protein K0S65_4908 [Labilithrix sp.]|jgi:hypothetical protein|nr:hypothetical protein [Labilithrix sp.]
MSSIETLAVVAVVYVLGFIAYRAPRVTEQAVRDNG